MSKPELPDGEPADPETEILASPTDGTDSAPLPTVTPGERRFTAPSGMDAGFTEIIQRTPAEPETEIFTAVGDTTKAAVPQSIPASGKRPRLPGQRRSWGWVLAILLVIAALVAIAVLGTMLLTRNSSAKAAPADQVRDTIKAFDSAIQRGDLPALRSITCGATAEGYRTYDDRKWAETHARVAAAGQYPVVASIDEVVVNGDRAEANVTAFFASDPATRSPRSFDLQRHDGQWQICQAA